MSSPNGSFPELLLQGEHEATTAPCQKGPKGVLGFPTPLAVRIKLKDRKRLRFEHRQPFEVLIKAGS